MNKKIAFMSLLLLVPGMMQSVDKPKQVNPVEELLAQSFSQMQVNLELQNKYYESQIQLNGVVIDAINHYKQTQTYALYAMAPLFLAATAIISYEFYKEIQEDRANQNDEDADHNDIN